MNCNTDNLFSFTITSSHYSFWLFIFCCRQLRSQLTTRSGGRSMAITVPAWWSKCRQLCTFVAVRADLTLWHIPPDCHQRAGSQPPIYGYDEQVGTSLSTPVPVQGKCRHLRTQSIGVLSNSEVDVSQTGHVRGLLLFHWPKRRC